LLYSPLLEEWYIQLQREPAMTSKTALWNFFTDEDRIEILNSLPNYLDGFLKTWGWLNFSKATEQKIIEKNSHLISYMSKELNEEEAIEIFTKAAFGKEYDVKAGIRALLGRLK
jgi:hypothetical protein